MENTLNLRKKLNDIDSIMKKDIFEATEDNICPSMEFKINNLKTTRSRRNLSCLKDHGR